MGGPWVKLMAPEERARVEALRHQQALTRGRTSHANNREQRRLASAEKYRVHGEQMREAARQKHEADPNYETVRKLRTKYGISLAAWLAMFAQQGERCACCRTDKPGHKYGWSTDHEHGTKPVIVRGIVCAACNLRLGMLGDHYLEAALRASRDLEYLKRFA